MLTQVQITDIAKVVAIAVANALTQMNTQQPKAAKAKTTGKTSKPQPKAAQPDRKAAFAAAVVATFKAAGLSVTPNVDVLTYGKWEALGFKPKTGEKATFVKTKDMTGNGIALFHQSQVEKIA